MRRLLLGMALGFGVFALARSAAGSLTADKRVPDPNARMYVLEREKRLAAPLDEVFAFFNEPRNLGELTPDEMRFEIKRMENLPMQAGTYIQYTISPGGVPMNWETEIVEYEPGASFVDLQTAGPYRYLRHRHSFEADSVATGDETIMRDRGEYQLPFGVLGALAHDLVVRPQLERIFDFRNEIIDQLFSASEPDGGEQSQS